MKQRGSRWLHTLRPETLHALNDRVVELAMQAKVTKGRKLRLDASLQCRPRSIIPPIVACSSTVCACSPAVWQRAKGLVKEHLSNVQQVCRSRLRTARRVAQTLHRQLRRKGEDKEAEQKQLYEKLIQTAERMVRQSRRVSEALSEHSEQQTRQLLTTVEEVLPLVERVIAQTRTRVLQGKKVASEQKVLSLFEPHTRAIPRHKGGALVEFGRQVMLDEVEGGIVTRYEILEHPNEHGQAIEAVAHHCALFEHPPNLVAGDRGVHSAETEAGLTVAGVKHVAIPASGKLSAERQAKEHTRAFRRGYRLQCGH
jgi:IS5 family transposase